MSFFRWIRRRPNTPIEETPKIQPRAWRTFRDDEDQWSEENVKRLKAAIPKITDESPEIVMKGKILLMGPIQSGKSSFVNSILGIVNDMIVQIAPAGSGLHSMTLMLSQFVCGNILVCDTKGLEAQSGAGLNTGDIQYLLKGNIPNSYKFDKGTPISDVKESGFIENPTIADRVHCVIFCIGANDVQNHVPDGYLNKWRELLTEINTHGVPVIILLTKIDVICEDVKNDLAITFESKKIHDVVKGASELFGVPEMLIHPVKNFTNETFPERKPSVLLLLALKSALDYTSDCITKINTDHTQAEAKKQKQAEAEKQKQQKEDSKSVNE